MNIADFEDIQMTSREKQLEFRQDYMTEYMRPIMNTMIRMTAKQLQRLPSEVKAESQKRNPAEWEVLNGMEKPV